MNENFGAMNLLGWCILLTLTVALASCREKQAPQPKLSMVPMLVGKVKDKVEQTLKGMDEREKQDPEKQKQDQQP